MHHLSTVEDDFRQLDCGLPIERENTLVPKGGTVTAKEDISMNGSERDELNEMIRRYQEDLARYAQRNLGSNVGNQYTGNMPSCGSQASPVNTGIDTGNPTKTRRLPDATPPMRIPDASTPVEAAGTLKNHADNRTIGTATSTLATAEQPVPEAIPPSPMDEELMEMGGWEPNSGNGGFSGSIQPTPLYSSENRVTVPSGRRVNNPAFPPVSNAENPSPRSQSAPMSGGQGNFSGTVQAATMPNAGWGSMDSHMNGNQGEGGVPANQTVASTAPIAGGQGTMAVPNQAPTSGSTRNAAVPLPLASGNVGIRPATPVEQSPWGPTSAQPPARSESSETAARSRAPQYADLTATTPNTPTSHPLPSNPQGRENEVSLREQNIARVAVEDPGNPRARQSGVAPPANSDDFVIPSTFSAGGGEALQSRGPVSSQLMRDLEAASQLLTEEGIEEPAPGVESLRNSELMSRLSATGMNGPTPPALIENDSNELLNGGMASNTADDGLIPSVPRPQSSVSLRESSVQPNGVYQTESEYPVRELEDWESDEGTITVYAYTARQGLPVPDADVTISRVFEGKTVLHFFTTTGISGETVPRGVPAPPREWSQSPGYEHPYASYSIQVDAPGYYTVENINVPVFGGEASIQPVEMIPLPENEKFIREKVVFESEPADL